LIDQVLSRSTLDHRLDVRAARIRSVGDKPAPIDGWFGNLDLGDEQSIPSCCQLLAFAVRRAGPSIYVRFHELSSDLMASVLQGNALLFHHGDEALATIRICGELLLVRWLVVASRRTVSSTTSDSTVMSPLAEGPLTIDRFSVRAGA
jgi:hypothetical protein